MKIYSNTITKKRVPTNQERYRFAGTHNFLLNDKNLSFKGMPTVKAAVEIFRKEVGSSAGENLDKIIENVLKAENTGVEKLRDGSLKFAEDTFGKKMYRAIVDPVVYFPLDLANSTLNLLKKIPGLKTSKFIDGLLKKAPLKNRSESLETYSNAMAVKHYFVMLGDKNLAKDGVLKEAMKRFKIGQTPYTVKGERSLTRVVSGIIPAFFLANDAYNLSMYMNNNKDVAKKEKKRRFYQELSRVAVTAAATFGTLGFFSKKVSSNPAMAAGIIAALTFCSELIGRMLVGTPVYPLGEKGAKKYAKLQNKGKLKQNNNEKNVDSSKSSDKKKKSKSNYVMKLLGGLVLAGFLIDKHQYIKPVRKLVNNLKSKYTEFFAKDYKISRKKFNDIIVELRKKGFEPLAQHYQKKLNNILKQGNLTTKEQIQVEREIDNRIEQGVGNKFIMTSKELKEAQNEAREEIIRKEVLKDLKLFRDTENDNIIYINGDLNKFFSERTNVDKVKDNIINGVLALPVKFAWAILNMPYKYVVKPLIEIPVDITKKLVKVYNKEISSKEKFNLKKIFKALKEIFKVKNKTINDDDLFRRNIEFLEKNFKASDFKEKVNKNIIDSFDNVNKSNISSAELAGSAKVAVSTATSTFLILDNYNMVMIDSEGKDKKLAGQKAKERIIQRIIRIAYGACLIKLFNGLFKSPYEASLLGAEAVTAGNVLLTEMLERTSVGMPLHEATREEIIQKDNDALKAKGLKGAYFRFMSKLTGKKPISKKKADKSK